MWRLQCVVSRACAPLQPQAAIQVSSFWRYRPTSSYAHTFQWFLSSSRSLSSIMRIRSISSTTTFCCVSESYTTDHRGPSPSSPPSVGHQGRVAHWHGQPIGCVRSGGIEQCVVCLASSPRLFAHHLCRRFRAFCCPRFLTNGVCHTGPLTVNHLCFWRYGLLCSHIQCFLACSRSDLSSMDTNTSSHTLPSAASCACVRATNHLPPPLSVHADCRAVSTTSWSPRTSAANPALPLHSQSGS